MTFPARRPHPAAAPRLCGAPAQGMLKGAPCPIERVSPVPSRGQWEGTALWGRAVAAARPGMEGSFSSGGTRRLRQLREYQEEEEMPEVEIDIDDLLDAANEEERALKLQETLVDCYKPTEEFIKELLTRIRGMRKLSPPQKKSI
uniref:Protein phosphatase 1 regulatory inhibitor subunit 14C n=1 Tax=Cyanistes caeruleus TaxID=156563 RepID=A0A8C0UT69_CYACU